jgi:anthranilate synthase component I
VSAPDAARPSPGDFARAYGRGEAQVVWTSLVADLETPVSAFLKLAEARPYGFLLESVEGGAVRGRYSIIGAKPDLVWRCRGARAEVNRRARLGGGGFEAAAEPALDSLRALVAESRIAMPEGLPPPAAGLFGHMAYDMVRLMERLPAANEDRLGLPDAVFVRPTLVAVFDNIEDRITLVTPVYPSPDVPAARAYDLALERLADATADLGRGVRHEPPPPRRALAPIEPVPNMGRDDYVAAVERAKAYIAAGDIFQVVPSQRFAVRFGLPPVALYRALRRLNPSPFLFYLDLDGHALVGSSPEILVRLRDGKVTIRPLAGTRRRGATPAEDEALAREMLADPKELAEHLMLLDLGRNDVGRVAEIGSVAVTEKMVVERYSHVMHISSTVEGRIRPGLDAIDALVAGFPAGTVTGAPKVRAMEIIEELEPERRGFYAGTVGYFAADGSMDTCIALRTALVKDGVMYAQAGAGVVNDSDPEAEYQETISKARALVRAAEEAVRFATGGAR